MKQVFIFNPQSKEFAGRSDSFSRVKSAVEKQSPGAEVFKTHQYSDTKKIITENPESEFFIIGGSETLFHFLQNVDLSSSKGYCIPTGEDNFIAEYLSFKKGFSALKDYRLNDLSKIHFAFFGDLKFAYQASIVCTQKCSVSMDIDDQVVSSYNLKELRVFNGMDRFIIDLDTLEDGQTSETRLYGNFICININGQFVLMIDGVEVDLKNNDNYNENGNEFKAGFLDNSKP